MKHLYILIALVSFYCHLAASADLPELEPSIFLPKEGLVLKYTFYENGKPVGGDTKTSLIKNGKLHLAYPDGSSQEFLIKDENVYSRFTYEGSDSSYDIFFGKSISLNSEWKSEDGIIARVTKVGEYELFGKKRKFFDLQVTYPPNSISDDQNTEETCIEQYAEGLGYIGTRRLSGEIEEKLVSVKKN